LPPFDPGIILFVQERGRGAIYAGPARGVAELAPATRHAAGILRDLDSMCLLGGSFLSRSHRVDVMVDWWRSVDARVTVRVERSLALSLQA
jgi:hypothetical protein